MASVERNSESFHPARGGRMFAMVSVLLVLYVLSPGPVLLLIGQLPPNFQETLLDFFEIAYWPLSVIYENVPTAAFLYDRYFEMLNVPT